MTLDLSHRPGRPATVVARDARRDRVVETWELRGASDDRIRATVHVPESVRRVVVVAHGGGGSRDERYVAVLGRSLVRIGAAAVAIDAPGHGDRPAGELPPGLPGLHPRFVERWVQDHRRLLDAVGSRWPGLPVGFVGFSMGGLFGVPLMAADDRVAASVLLLAGSTRVSYPMRTALDRAALDALELTDPAVHAPAVGQRPVLLIGARDDAIVTPEAVRVLADAFPGPVRLEMLRGTHTHWDHAARWYRSVTRFLDVALA